MKHRTLKTSAVMGMLLSIVLGTRVYAAPIGGQVVSGNSTINQGGNTTTINQKSQNTQINWQKFNIAKNETVNFVQPNKSAVALNKVVGNDASAIYGNLNANGQVFLVNPNGILFGKTASVNVGGLVASTLDIKANQNGKYTFEGSGGTITNEGNLKANGNLVLAASIVNNQGTITNNSGTTQLVAADKITLDTGEVYTLTVDKGALNAQINNGGAIYGNDGKVYLTAKGRDSLSNAVINHTGVIEANAVKSGEGGKIILLSDMSTGTTNVSGTLNAKGITGNGGFIETSGAKVKIADSAKISTASENGKYGTWLIDPNDFTIASSGGDMTGATLSSNLENNAEVTIESSSGGTAGNGDIFVNDTISWNAAHKLILNAYRNIEINSPITATAGSVALYYGQGAVAASNTATYTINMKNGFKAGNGAINLSAGNNFSTKLGSDGDVKTYTVITALGSVGDESKSTTNSLQGLANSGKLSGNYVLGADIDASDTAVWNSNAGFVPIGNDTNNFTGVFDGLGHTISGLTINRPTTNYVGLFGYTNSAAISNVGVVGGSITGDDFVGGLVGEQNNGSIENAYATGAVTGTGSDVGGLVGEQNNGSIENAYATGAVTGTSFVGGLMGEQNNGSIENAYATGAVIGNSSAGGLVGCQDSGSIKNAYATGAVTGLNSVGGLVGIQQGSITNAYATGVVTGSGQSNQIIGGLVGHQADGSITNAYATGDVTGTTAVGGLVGLQYHKGSIKNAYATGDVTGTAGFAGGLVGQEQGSVTNAYATGDVTGTTAVGGLVGWNKGNITNVYATGKVSGTANVGGLLGYKFDGTITSSYWDNTVNSDSKYDNGIGNGTSTENLKKAETFTDWDLDTTGGQDNVWRIYEGNTSPLLKVFLKTMTVTADVSNNNVTYNGKEQSAVVSNIKYNGSTTKDDKVKGDATIVVATGTNAGTYNVTMNGLYSTQDGYDIVNGLGDLTINKATLTLNAVEATKTYDGTTDSTATVEVKNLQDGDSISDLKQTYDSKNVKGTNGSTLSVLDGYTITDGNGGNNYIVIKNTKNGTITAKALDLNAVTWAKEYDGTVSSNGNVTHSDLATGDSISNLHQGYDSKNVKETDGSTLNVLDGYTILDADKQDMSGNYTVTKHTHTGTITAKDVTISGIAADNKIYDGGKGATLVTNSAAVDGKITDDDLSISGTASGAFADKNAGTGKTVSITGLSLSGTDAGNYNLIGIIDTTANISAKALELKAVTGTKEYDGTVISNGTVTYSDLAAGDSISNLYQVYDSKNVMGTDGSTLRVLIGYTIKDGNNGGNYTVTTKTASGTITPKTLTLNAGTDSKEYDGTTTSKGTVTYSQEDLAINDSISVLTQAFDSKNVLGEGKSILSVTGYSIADGNNGGNYKVVKNTAIGTITKADLKITAVKDTKVYDGTTAGTKANIAKITVEGLVGTDNVTDLTQVFNSKNVKDANKVSIQYSKILDGNKDDMGGNYSVTLLDASDSKITPQEITGVSGIIANNKTYDGNTTATLVTTGATLSGNLDGTNLTIGSATGTFADKNAGTGKKVTINGITLSGSEVGNYTLKGNTESETTADINKATLTLNTATDTKEYDGTTTSTGVVGHTDLVGNDDISGLTQAYDSKNVMGTNGSTLRVLNGYTILDTDSKDMSGNYAITANTASGTITPKAITGITGLVTNGKTYDGTNTHSLNTANATLSGVVAGDNLTVTSATGTYATKNAGDNIGISVGNIVLGGTDAGNYAVTSATALPELTGSIGKGSLYVTADDIERNSGIPFSFDGTEFTASGLTSGETVSYVALNSDGAVLAAAPGTYAINISGAIGSFAPANYNITYKNGILTVKPMEAYKFAAAYPIQTISRHRKDDTLYGNGTTIYSQDYLRKREVKEDLPTITVLGTGINTGNV